jgi:hypothetical protein
MILFVRFGGLKEDMDSNLRLDRNFRGFSENKYGNRVMGGF